MKTAMDQLERMEALCRKMAAQWANENKSSYGLIGSGLAYIDVASYREAVAIVSELPEPVDADVVWARGLVASVLDGIAHPDTCHAIRRGRMDNDNNVALIASSLRRAREEGVKC